MNPGSGGSLTVNGGTQNDLLAVESLSAAYAGALTLSGGGGTDTVAVNQPLTVGGSFTATATTIQLNRANVTSTGGKYGGALQFTGALNSMVNIPDAPSLHLTTGMTLEAWIKPTSLKSADNGWVAAISKDHVNSPNDISYALYAANGTGTASGGHVLIGNSDRGAVGGAKLTLNQWTFLTATYDGSTIRLRQSKTGVPVTIPVGGPLNPLKAALDAAWPEALALFEATHADDTLLANGILSATPDAQRDTWEASVRPMLEGCGLAVPAVPASAGGRRGRHTPEFARLHAQMTEVWRIDPEARW